MKRADIKTNYSVGVDYAVSTQVYNRIINRNGENEESIVVVNQPKSLTSVAQSTESQKREVEAIKYGSGKKESQADCSNLDDIKKNIESGSYEAKASSFKAEADNLHCKQEKPTIEDLLGEE